MPGFWMMCIVDAASSRVECADTRTLLHIQRPFPAKFPDALNSKNDSLEEISWDEFFKQFDENELALVFEEKSNFNKIISRDSSK